MKKFTIILLLLALLLAGCNATGNNKSKETNNNGSPEPKEVLTEVTGVLETKYIENDIMYIILEVRNDSRKFDASDLEDFDLLKDGQILTLTHDDNNKVIELENVEDPLYDENESIYSDNRVISYVETISFEGLTEYKSSDLVNFPEFGIEKVTMYTDAENDGQGNFYWDDGNRFVLIAHKDQGGYILFDQRIQVGEIKANIYSVEDTLNISVLDYGTANISFRVYRLVDGDFIEHIKYQGEGNINMLSHL